MKLRVTNKPVHNWDKRVATEKDLDFGGTRQGPGPGRGRAYFALTTGPEPLPAHLLKF